VVINSAIAVSITGEIRYCGGQGADGTSAAYEFISFTSNDQDRFHVESANVFQDCPLLLLR